MPIFLHYDKANERSTKEELPPTKAVIAREGGIHYFRFNKMPPKKLQESMMKDVEILAEKKKLDKKD